MWRKLPKNFNTSNPSSSVKNVIDRIDKEAMAEGSAIRNFRHNYSPDAPVGKRLARMRNSEARGGAIVAVKRVTKFTKDHNNAIKKYMG